MQQGKKTWCVTVRTPSRLCFQTGGVSARLSALPSDSKGEGGGAYTSSAALTVPGHVSIHRLWPQCALWAFGCSSRHLQDVRVAFGLHDIYWGIRIRVEITRNSEEKVDTQLFSWKNPQIHSYWACLSDFSHLVNVPPISSYMNECHTRCLQKAFPSQQGEHNCDLNSPLFPVIALFLLSKKKYLN